MERPFDDLKDAVWFEKPLRITDISSWHGHIPFAFAIMSLLKPSVFVELGTHKGDSYCAFCQGVRKLKIDCQCYAVDSWEGDEHAGFYSLEVFKELKAYHDPRYGHFSELLKMRFDEALAQFPNAGIDLLHIDGLHSYEAVKHDFESWLPKMSPRGMVLLHDTHVYTDDFGVWKLWQELEHIYPGFNFYHSHGLGLLGVGHDLSPEVTSFLNLDQESLQQVRREFYNLGNIALEKTCQRPKISVIIPVYNHEKYIHPAIDSVLNQTMGDLELIIINDGSQDRSEEMIMEFRDSRIQYIYQENQGAPNTINRGLQLARGEYISVLNSDDVYALDRFEECLGILEEEPSIQAVFSHVESIDDQGHVISYKKGSEDHALLDPGKITFTGDHRTFLDLLSGNFLVSTSNLFCRKNVFEHIGYFSNLKYAHDYDFFLRLCYHFKVHIMEKPLLSYRIHSSNTIKENEAETNFELGIIFSNFFLNYDIKKLFPEEDVYTLMAKFFNSINTHHSERMVMTLTLFASMYNLYQQFFKELTENQNNPFRKACTRYFKNHLDMWQESQEAWKKWHEANERLIGTDKRLSELEQEAKKWWLNSQEGWEKWREINERLIIADKKLGEAEKEIKKWWLDSEEAWKKWQESNEQLIESQEKLLEMEKEANRWQDHAKDAQCECREVNERLLEAYAKIKHLQQDNDLFSIRLIEKESKLSQTRHELAEMNKTLSLLEQDKEKWRQSSQEGWKKCSHLNHRIIETENRLSQAESDAKKWQMEAQDALKKWQETNKKLIHAEKKLSQSRDESIEKTHQIHLIVNSVSFRMGRFLTGPLRKIRYFFRTHLQKKDIV